MTFLLARRARGRLHAEHHRGDSQSRRRIHPRTGTGINRLRDLESARFRLGNLGFVFRQFHLIPALSCGKRGSAAFAALEAPGRDRKSAHDTGRSEYMADRANALPNKLSGGEQQRVAFARALIQIPSSSFAMNRPLRWTAQRASHYGTLRK